MGYTEPCNNCIHCKIPASYYPCTNCAVLNHEGTNFFINRNKQPEPAQDLIHTVKRLEKRVVDLNTRLELLEAIHSE